MNDPYTTYFGKIDDFRKGGIEIISGRASHYVFSNIFEVASHAVPWEKIVVGKNLEYVVEAIRAEGVSPWYVCSHDEFAIVVDGTVRIDYVALHEPQKVGNGTSLLGKEPVGNSMGYVVLRRGHQAILPAGRAYRFSASAPGVIVQQTILGPLSIEKWAEICLH